MKKLKKGASTTKDLDFKPLSYSDEYPPIHCCMCGKAIQPTGAYQAGFAIPGNIMPYALTVCSEACLFELKGPRAHKVDAYIAGEIDRIGKLFPKKGITR